MLEWKLQSPIPIGKNAGAQWTDLYQRVYIAQVRYHPKCVFLVNIGPMFDINIVLEQPEHEWCQPNIKRASISNLKSKNNPFSCHTKSSSNGNLYQTISWTLTLCQTPCSKALLLHFLSPSPTVRGRLLTARAPACPGQALGLRRSRFPVGTSDIPAPANQAPPRPAGLQFRKRRICGSQTEARRWRGGAIERAEGEQTRVCEMF